MTATGTKHTPGPWKYIFSECGGYNCMSSGFRIENSTAMRLATVDVADYAEAPDWGTMHTRNPEAEANARLFAKSLALLKLLKEVRAGMSATCSDGCTCGDGWQHDDPELMARIDAAIAEVEGK